MREPRPSAGDFLLKGEIKSGIIYVDFDNDTW